MSRKRILFPGTMINDRDPENHFKFQDQGLQDYNSELLQRIMALKPLEGKILHIGCGTAAFEILTCDKIEYGQFVGLEQSRTILRIGEAVISRFGYAERISLRIWEDDLLPFPDNGFDHVISLCSLHQWRNIEKTLEEIERVRKKDGLVFLSDIRRDQLYLPFYLFAGKMASTYGKEIGQNLLSGYKASYTSSQLQELLARLGLTNWETEKNGKWINVISLGSEGNMPVYSGSSPEGNSNIQERV